MVTLYLSIGFNESLLVGLCPLGGIIGCITGGVVVAIGRRNLVIILGIITIITTFLETTGDYLFFAIGRFIQGICLGYYSFITPLYRLLPLIYSP